MPCDNWPQVKPLPIKIIWHAKEKITAEVSLGKIKKNSPPIMFVLYYLQDQGHCLFSISMQTCFILHKKAKHISNFRVSEYFQMNSYTLENQISKDFSRARAKIIFKSLKQAKQLYRAWHNLAVWNSQLQSKEASCKSACENKSQPPALWENC